jgi:hypothetical protein
LFSVPLLSDRHLKDFNSWIGKKRGRGYDRKTLKTAIAQLYEQTEGLIIQQKEITWYYRKIIVKPIAFLAQEKTPKKEQSPKTESLEPLSTGKDNSKQFQQQQQNISKIDGLLRKINLRFDRDALNRIWQLSGKCFDRILQSIELLLHRNCHKTIANPHGFLVDCLKYNWSEGFDLYYQPELPQFNSSIDLRKFIKKLKLT